jgi:hypothetical protein
MTRSIRFKTALVGGSACLLITSSQLFSQVANGLYVMPRVYNDYPNSTETYTVNAGPPIVNPAVPFGVAGLPSSVDMTDTNLLNSPASGFANLDEIVASTTGGASPYVASIDQGFTLSADVSVNGTTTGSGTPRKEAGLRVISPVAGDALFILDTDASEIVAFGAGAPFYSFRPALEADYTPGQFIFMKEQYVPAVGGTTGANPGTMQYWAQLLNANLSPAGPLMTSGPLLYSNNEGGPTAYEAGVYDQAPDATTTSADSIAANFNNINASFTSVPEPISMGMLAIGAFSLLSRRRRALKPA